MARAKWGHHRECRPELDDVRTRFGETGERLLAEFFVQRDILSRTGKAQDEGRKGSIRVFRVATLNAVLYTFFCVPEERALFLLHVSAQWCAGASSGVGSGPGVWVCPPLKADWELAESRLATGGV